MTALTYCAILSYVKNERPENDLRLVESCIAMDLSAWSKLTKKYSDLISISIENRLKKYGIKFPSCEIEDIKQDVLTFVWKGKKLETVRNRGNIACWLAVVSGNIAIEYAQKMRKAAPSPTVSLQDKIGEKEIAEFVASYGTCPKDGALRKELARGINDAIGSLPAKERLIMELNLIHEKKYHEIAEILRLPTGTISSYIKRAKEKLKEKLRDFL